MKETSTSIIDCYILTGGASRRMGRDKATIAIDGLSMAERIAANLGPVVRNLYTVGDIKVGELESIPDNTGFEQNVKSSLAGLVSALRHAKTEWIFVVACDMPFVTAELFHLLAATIGQGKSAIVPTDIDGRIQPTCSFYRAADCLVEAEAALANDRHSLKKLLAEIEMQVVPFERVSRLSGSARLFVNVNTPEDLILAEQLLQAPM